jgi:hypothetical protein
MLECASLHDELRELYLEGFGHLQDFQQLDLWPLIYRRTDGVNEKDLLRGSQAL